jgi:hypothetical protein
MFSFPELTSPNTKAPSSMKKKTHTHTHTQLNDGANFVASRLDLESGLKCNE